MIVVVVVVVVVAVAVAWLRGCVVAVVAVVVVQTRHVVVVVEVVVTVVDVAIVVVVVVVVVVVRLRLRLRWLRCLWFRRDLESDVFFRVTANMHLMTWESDSCRPRHLQLPTTNNCWPSRAPLGLDVRMDGDRKRCKPRRKSRSDALNELCR